MVQRQRLSDEQITAIRAERAQAVQVIEALKKVLGLPDVTTSHPQLAPYVQVLGANPQVPKLVWFSAIRFAGYEPVLMARYPGAEGVALAMRDAVRKAGYTPAERLEWPEFRGALKQGLTHDEWEGLMRQLPELPKRERRSNPAAAAATSLLELLQAQQQPRPETDDEDEEDLTPPQQIRLTLQGAEPARTPTALTTSLPELDLSAFTASPGTPTAPTLPDLSKVLQTAPTPTVVSNGSDPSAELKFKLELAKAEGKDVALLLQFVDVNPDGVRKLAAAKGITL